MLTVPVEIQMLVAGLLFLIALTGLLVRRNIIYMLLCVEIMLNSAGFAFVIAGSKWAQPDGQVMFIFILAVAAAEVSVAMALILQMYKHFKTLNVKALSTLGAGEDAENTTQTATEKHPDV
jgi:NADH-quinone oxidoreductase subunit K